MSAISDDDRTISSLKSIITSLEEQTAQISARIASLSAKARSALQQNSRGSALAALRSKKLNEAALMQRSETLTQLEEVYAKIEQSADQINIVSVLKASTAVLKNLHAKTGGVEKVEDVVEGLRDEMRNVDEVSRVLEAGGLDHDLVDENSVDEEFENMERQARLEEEEAQTLKIRERLAGIDNSDSASQAAEPQEIKTNAIRNVPVEDGTTASKYQSLEEQAAPDTNMEDDSRGLAEA